MLHAVCCAHLVCADGLGQAACNAVPHMVATTPEQAELLAVHTCCVQHALAWLRAVHSRETA